MSEHSVIWTEVGPRDGLQNVSATVRTDLKIRMIRDLLDTGVPRVEATSFVSPKWVPQLADAADVLSAFSAEEKKRLRVLIPNQKGLEMALSNGVSNVVLTIGATDSFNMRNINRTVVQSLEDLTSIIATARGVGATVDVALSVCFGCPFEGAVEQDHVVAIVREICDAGASEVAVADTIGVADPHQVDKLAKAVAKVVDLNTIAMHFHDTRGMAIANIAAAVHARVTRFEGSVGGLGGCPFAPRSTGNVCSEDALFALQRSGISTGCDIEKYCDIANWLAETLAIDLPGKVHRAGTWWPQQKGNLA